MVQKIFFNIILFFGIILLSGITKDTNYINFTGYIDASTQLDITDIEQKAGYNFIITDLQVINDCFITNNCTTGFLDFYIDDSTGSGNIQKFYYHSYTKDETTKINIPELKITGILNINNSSGDAGLFYNITGYYLEENDNFFSYLEKQLLNNSVNNVISILILYIICVYLFYFFAKTGFKVGKDYFNKKRKYEND